MRGLGFFFGSAKRNEPVKLEDPRPIARQPDALCSGDPAADGFTLLSRADPKRQGNPPPVEGVEGYVYQGPDQSFEQ